MSLDLAQPRAIRPLVPPPEPPASAPSGGGAAPPGRAAAGDARPTPRTRTAVHVRLTEDVLRELVDLARKGPPGALDGALRLDLGSQPAFVVNGVRHALSVHPEAPNTELVRLSSSSRDLQPIAAVTHRANVQHTKADLDKAGQRARENRELAEKEKDSRRAVLLDSAPAKLHARSLSHNRPSRPHTPLGGPASAPSSRTASPASTVRQPSRLTAVPPKPPTSSSFRIGKGTVPSSIALSRGTSSSSSSGTGGGAASPPRVAALAAASDVVDAPATARQDSASSSASSSSETSLLQKTSGASVTSPESLTLGDTTKAAQAERDDKPVAATPRAGDKDVPAAGAAKGPVRAGGGLMKGKETLKKEKKREERAKGRGSVPAKRSSDVAQAQASSQDKDVDGEDEDAPGEPDVVDEAPARPAPAKKRRLETDERGSSGVSSGRTSSTSRNGASSTPAPKPVVKTKVVTKVVAVPKSIVDRGSGSEASRSDSRSKPSTVGDKPRGRERREGTADSKASPPPALKKKKKAETDRWYSSSSEDEADSSSSTASSVKPPRRPTAPKRPSGPVKSAPPAGSPLRNSTSAAALRASPPIVTPPPLPPVPVSTAADFSSSRIAFFESYATYAVAHSRLVDERHRLERGEPGTLEPGEARRLVQDVLRRRGELEALREGMKRFAAAGEGAAQTA
ncbi:hypothetical protein JCM8208_002532 [Rhodotorula glutinis]